MFARVRSLPRPKILSVMRRLCLGDSRSPPDKVFGRASSRSPHVPNPLGRLRRFEMKFAWITAALVCFAGMNSADAGLFSKKSNCGCAPAPSCCAPAPTCAAPAPSCCAPAPAPAPVAPSCCAPAPAAVAPSCCAPAAVAPTCCAPAVTSCCQPKACKVKKARKSLRDMFAGFKKSKKHSCCGAAPSCCAPVAPTCAAPVAPTCAVPAAACCN